MTSVLKEDDKIFTMYKQYKELIHKDVEKKDNRVYGTDQLAAQLTVAHMLDHVVCLNISKEDKLPTARKVNNTWKEKFDDSAEEEIMRNNFEVTGESPITTSTVADSINWSLVTN